MQKGSRKLLLYERPANNSPLYLLSSEGERHPIVRFIRRDENGRKQPFDGGEVYIGDIAVIRKRDRESEIVLEATSIITDLAS